MSENVVVQPSAETGLVAIASQQGMLAVLQGRQGAPDVPKPFAEPILLVASTRVAGTSYVERIDEFADALVPGERLAFVRAPANPHDGWAIRVENAQHERLGYVPADQNEILARLMDGGKCVFGKVLAVELIGRWYKIEMEVYLDD